MTKVIDLLRCDVLAGMLNKQPVYVTTAGCRMAISAKRFVTLSNKVFLYSAKRGEAQMYMGNLAKMLCSENLSSRWHEREPLTDKYGFYPDFADCEVVFVITDEEDKETFYHIVNASRNYSDSCMELILGKKGELVEEPCPKCGEMNRILWSGEARTTFCHKCSTEFAICSLCEPDTMPCEGGSCPYMDERKAQKSKQETMLRKVAFTNGMSDDIQIIITDAPKEAIENWCYRYNEAVENGTFGKEVQLFDSLMSTYYCHVIFDSEVGCREDAEIIGYDEQYDLTHYLEEEMNEEKLKKLAESLIFLLYDKTMTEYKGLDDEEFVGLVCKECGISKRQYFSFVD